MLEENASRRPEFRSGLPLRMADGQVWSLPIPFVKDGEAGEAVSIWDDSNYRAILRAIAEAEDSGELFRAELALAVHLLRWNYVLTGDNLDEIFEDRGPGRSRFDPSEALHVLASAHLGPAACRAPVDPRDDPGTPIIGADRPTLQLTWRLGS